MRITKRFVLASQSPRRRILLEHVGLTPDVVPADIDETSAESDASRLVLSLARMKANAVAKRMPDALVLGADTSVSIDGVLLGKPEDPEDARRMLRTLSGRTHAVHTGISLVEERTGRSAHGVERTEVTFARLSEAEIDAYVATGSPFDKAGAYGIQDDRGAFFVSSIHGDYYNVVGLPLRKLYELLTTVFPDRLQR